MMTFHDSLWPWMETTTLKLAVFFFLQRRELWWQTIVSTGKTLPACCNATLSGKTLQKATAYIQVQIPANVLFTSQLT